jgi:hypothetical protein
MTRTAFLAIAWFEIKRFVLGSPQDLIKPTRSVLTDEMIREIERILRLTPEQRLDEISFLSRQHQNSTPAW